MTYYKVTTLRGLSICVAREHKNTPFCVQYKVGEWVEPKVIGTKLFCFDQIEAAKNFGYGEAEYWFRLWECEVTNPTKTYEYYYSHVYSAHWVTILEEMLSNGITSNTYTGLWPAHTVFCDAVKLVKEIPIRWEE